MRSLLLVPGHCIMHPSSPLHQHLSSQTESDSIQSLLKNPPLYGIGYMINGDHKHDDCGQSLFSQNITVFGDHKPYLWKSYYSHALSFSFSSITMSCMMILRMNHANMISRSLVCSYVCTASVTCIFCLWFSVSSLFHFFPIFYFGEAHVT